MILAASEVSQAPVAQALLGRRLEPNSAAPEADQERASITIRALRLNEHGQPMARIRALKDFGRLAPEEQSLELRDFPYRFMLS